MSYSGFDEMEPKLTKIIKGNKENFEIHLDKALKNGWEIPPGESMKANSNIYCILVTKKKESKDVKKFI